MILFNKKLILALLDLVILGSGDMGFWNMILSYDKILYNRINNKNNNNSIFNCYYRNLLLKSDIINRDKKFLYKVHTIDIEIYNTALNRYDLTNNNIYKLYNYVIKNNFITEPLQMSKFLQISTILFDEKIINTRIKYCSFFTKIAFI